MKRLTKTLIPAVAVAALVLTGCAGTSSAQKDADSDDPIVVQFVPTRTEDDMQAEAKPLADLLSEQLDREVKVNIATDYATIVEAMASGKVDVGIMPPASYVLAYDQGAAEAVLQAQIPGTVAETSLESDELVDGFHGEIIVKADSGIDDLTDLKGKTIAAQNAASASGYIFPVVEMADAGLDVNNDVTFTTVAGIDSAILAVINGDVDAAFSFEGGRRLLLNEFPDVTDRVKVMYLTDALIPNDAIAVSTKLGDDLKEQITDAFLAIADDEEGHEIISTLYSHQGYVPADQEAYDLVRDYTERAADL